MSARHSSFRTWVLIVVFSFGILAIVDAQDVTSPANQNMVTQFTGKLKGFQRGIVSVEREDGTEVMVQMPDDIGSFLFVATAKPAFLQRGAMVRFSGTFNQAGVSMSPVGKVEVFQPISEKLARHLRDSFMPGVYPEIDHGNLQQLPTTAKCNVVGGLMGIDGNGSMIVQAGRQPVQVQLAEDAKFEIRFNHLNLAQEGDEVHVAGFYQPPDETKVKAERITVTTDRVYGEPGTETPTRGSRRKSKRSDEAAKPAVGVKPGEPAAAAEGK